MKPVKIDEIRVSEDDLVTVSFREKNNDKFDYIIIVVCGFVMGFAVASIIHI